MKKYRFRSAVKGWFVSAKFALANAATTIRESIKPRKRN